MGRPGSANGYSDVGDLIQSYVYDANGSRIEKRDASGNLVQKYIYDQKRRMTQLQQGAHVFNYRYDPSDYRIGINAGIATRDFYLEGEHLEAVYGPGGQITDKYLRGVVVDEVINGYHYDWPNKEKNLTFHHDHLNSVTAVTGHNGTTVETASYGPFGNMESETGPVFSGGEVANKLRYTGREFDRETGLYYYRARYYDPEVGRFLTEDPLGFEAGINFYSYVSNNPINFNDPTGLLQFETEDPVLNEAILGDIEVTTVSDILAEIISDTSSLGFDFHFKLDLELQSAMNDAVANMQAQVHQDIMSNISQSGPQDPNSVQRQL